MIFRALESTLPEAKPGPGAVEESRHPCRAVPGLVSPPGSGHAGVATKFPYLAANKILRSWPLSRHAGRAVFPIAGERLYLVEREEE